MDDIGFNDEVNKAVARVRGGADVTAEQARLLALVPALAVDTTGTRLGQGGGCYDRVLPALPSSTPVLVLLHPGEHTDAPLPRDPHDVPVRWVLTAGGLSPATEGSGPP